MPFFYQPTPMKTTITNPISIRAAIRHAAEVRYKSGGLTMLEPDPTWRGAHSHQRYRCLVCDEVWSARPCNITNNGTACPSCSAYNQRQRWGKIRLTKATEAEKQKTRELRAAGLTYTAISEQMGRSVSTVLRWCDPEEAEKDRRRATRYREANREQRRATTRRYQQQTPHGRANKRTSDAKRRGLEHDWYTNCPEDRSKEQAIYLECERITRETGVEYHVDHVWPLSQGGPHLWFNLQIITAEENLAKNNTYRPEDRAKYTAMIAELFNSDN